MGGPLIISVVMFIAMATSVTYTDEVKSKVRLYYIFIMRSYTRYTQTQANNNNDNNNKRKKRKRKIQATVQLTTQTTRPTQYIKQQLVSVRQN